MPVGSDSDSTAAPPQFLRLAGHPLRWRLLGELARSDRMVNELTGLVGQPQNLVSYHLAKLRAARLVSTRRSSADGRDAYYSADLSRVGTLLAATGAALHPGLRLTPPAAGAGRADRTTVRVLFLCTGNSARSQMAEALVRARSSGAVEARSAGSQPKALHPDAVRVMRDEHGIDLAGQRSKHLSELSDERFDWVITLCDRVREVCPKFPGRPETVHWSIADPAAAAADDETAAGHAAFRQTADELETRVRFLLAAINSPTTARQEEP